MKYVNINYFSARLKDGFSIEKAIAGIPKWCDIKNTAIRLPFPDYFQKNILTLALLTDG
ncbi:MAG TPA: hypothetical protein PLH76_08325 [Rectinema sp.]|nr:hypothetical protein [Spirochaetia bacterium]HPG97123.1 hypothetical protein [Rectinema sp.]HPN04009.1 hypothetical protein [Rectinema sp.]